MSGSKKTPFIAIDTNILFMALHNPIGKANKIIELANKGKISLFSTDTVRVELLRVIKRELNIDEEKIKEYIDELPIVWMGREIYSDFIPKTRVKHKADKPLEALSLALNCDILSADEHFKSVKNRADIDKLLREFG